MFSQNRLQMYISYQLINKGKCRNLSESTVDKYLKEGRKYVIRFKLDDKDIMYNDLTSGKHISNPGCFLT